MRGDPKKWNLFKKLCIYSYMFKWQSPSKYLPFDTIHPSRHFFHCSKQFLNWWIFFSMFKNCIFIFKITLLLFNYSGLHFLAPSPPPQPNPPPSLASILPLGFVHVSSIVVPENPSSIIPSHFPSGYCQIVLTFSVSGYILLALFFC